tara:strand:+ start:79 stop:357 length:279 start_codon:yes stop_codon:yes gene_type:complete
MSTIKEQINACPVFMNWIADRGELDMDIVTWFSNNLGVSVPEEELRCFARAIRRNGFSSQATAWISSLTTEEQNIVAEEQSKETTDSKVLVS